MKEGIALLISVVLLLFSFVGCNNTATDKTPVSTSASAVEQTITAAEKEAKIMESANDFVSSTHFQGKVVDKGDSLYILLVLPFVFHSSQISTAAQRLETRQTLGWDGICDSAIRYDNTLVELIQGTKFQKVTIAMAAQNIADIYLVVENGEKLIDVLAVSN